jgi:hypothetical protein
LFGILRRRSQSNAQHAIDVFADELPEYVAAASDHTIRTTMMDFGTFIRRCTLDRAIDGRALSADDLAMIRSAGGQRAENRLSLASQRRVLGLHTNLMVREIHEAATAVDTDDLLHLIGWLGQQGPHARDAYLQGYLSEVGRSWSVPARIGLLARALMADEPVVPPGGGLSVRPADRYLVVAVRVSDPAALVETVRERTVESLAARWKFPMDWTDPAEFVVLAPVAGTGTATLASEPGWSGTLELVRGLAATVGRRCAAGAAVGATGALAEPLGLARRISRAAPPMRVPDGLYTLADVFVELGVARDSQVDSWLDTVIGKLRAGPDLVRTLDAFYRHDMSRADTAAAMRIHPRTLDYRLRRVRDLTGTSPTSTQGVRILTSAVARVLARDES